MLQNTLDHFFGHGALEEILNTSVYHMRVTGPAGDVLIMLLSIYFDAFKTIEWSSLCHTVAECENCTLGKLRLKRSQTGIKEFSVFHF